MKQWIRMQKWFEFCHSLLRLHASLVLFCISIGFSPISINAQVPSNTFERIAVTANGIEPIGIGAIVQDAVGYIWMSTSLGLYRYDGFEFKYYPYRPDDSTSLFSEHVESIYLDKEGTLWVGSANGISRYSYPCDCFRNYSFKQFQLPAIASFTGTMVIDMAEDNLDNLWVIAHGGGLFRYDKGLDEFVRFSSSTPKSIAIDQYILRELIADKHGRLWIGTGYGAPQNGNGLICIDPVSGAIRQWLHEPDNPNSLMDNRVSALMEDDRGRIWIGTYRNGLHYLDSLGIIHRLQGKSDNPLGIFPPNKQGLVWGDDPFVKIIHQDRLGGYWIGTTGEGINYFPDILTEPRFFDPGKDLEESFRYYWAFFEDRQGIIWLGGISGSLFKYDLFGNNYHVYPEFKNAIFTQASKGEAAVVWVGNPNGIYRVNTQTGDKDHFYQSTDPDMALPLDALQCFFEDSRGDIWIGFGNEKSKDRGGVGDGLFKLDKRNGNFARIYLKAEDQISIVGIYDITEDTSGQLWLAGGTDGLYRSNRLKSNFDRILLNPESKVEETIYFTQNSGGYIWVSEKETNCLYRYSAIQKRFIPYLTGYSTSLIEQDHHENFWIGTFGKGLLRIDSTANITHFTLKDGLLGTHNVQVLESPQNTYWITSQNGLQKFILDGGKLISKVNLSGYFNLGASKGMDGRLYFPTRKGMVSFYPEEFAGNPIYPELFIDGVSSNGKKIHLDKDGIETLIFDYDQNDLSFEYNAFHFSDPRRNQYRYRLDPYDPDWIYGGVQKVARYTNLDHGKYTFVIQASNADGVWSASGATLDLTILPPWWMTWWALTLFAAGISILIYVMYDLQLSKQLAVEKQKHLEEINQFKSELYADITHEFRTPLTIILGMTDYLASNLKKFPLNGASKSLEMIKRNSKSLLHLVSEVLDISKIESGQMELILTQRNVISILKDISRDFQQLAIERNIQFDCFYLSSQILMDIDDKKFQRIIGNLLSNAFRYTEAGGKVQLHVEIDENSNALLIRVSDDGIGIPEEEFEAIFSRFYRGKRNNLNGMDGTGLGLAITKEYIQMMNGTIEVRSNLESGTSFIVKLPITNQAILLNEVHFENESDHLPAYRNYSDVIISQKNQDGDQPLLLIIEDNADLSYYLKTILEGTYNCLIVSNGDRGLQMALEQIPDIIICDVMLPQKNGYEICDFLKQDLRTDHIPIVLLTAKVTQKDKLTGYRYGADAYITKPFEKEELLLRLSTLIEIRKKLQQKYSRQNISRTGSQNIATDSFIEKAIQIIHSRIQDEEFSIEEFGDALNLSRSQLHRKIKALTGLSTALFIRSVRLKKAKELLESTELSISEIAYRSGFKSPAYFSQIFKKDIGESPAQYRD